MRPLSAAEAISPAIERTRTVLFRPFMPGRSWKVAATAYLSAMGAFFIPTPLFTFGAALSQPHANLFALLFSGILGILISVLMFGFFYIGARLEFVLFDIVLLNEKFVAPSWRRHAQHSWRWVGFKLLFSLAAGIVCGPLFFVAFRYLLPRVAAASAVPGHPPSPELFGNLLRFYALFGLPFVFALFCSSLLTNFVLPSIALENTTVREGLRRFLSLASSEPGPVSLFVLFKVLLAIAGFIAMEATIVIAEILCIIPLGLVGLAGWFALRSAGDAGHFLMLAGGILLLVLFVAFLFYCGMLALGALHIFFQAYALYFLGGRYPTLGDLLEPPAPAIPYAPPPPHVTPPGTLPIPPAEPAV